MEIQTLEIALIGLLIIVSAVGIVTRYLRVPYPIALVLSGLLVGIVIRAPVPYLQNLPFDEIQLTPDLILVLLLPPLLFEATLHIEAGVLRRWLTPIALLAVPGVIINAAIVGAVVAWTVGLNIQVGLLFGAIVAATDPIAVLAIFKRLGAPHELELLVEGESLFNDGTAVVLSRLLIGVVVAGEVNFVGGALNFVGVIGGGLVIGLLIGTIVSQLTARIDDHLIEITLTMILTYGAFLSAELLHVSGVISVVTAGLVLANVGAQFNMSPTTRLALQDFWEYVAFLVNSLIFLLIGLQVNLRDLYINIVPIAIAIVAVLLARAVVVYGLGLIVLPLPPALPRKWLLTLFWAGLRGAVSLAVVLGVPADLPERPLLLSMTFGVVLFTLLAQGLSMEWLLHRLGVIGHQEQHRTYLARRAQLLMHGAATRELKRLREAAVLSPRVFAKLDKAYHQTGEQLREELEGLYQDQSALEAEELRSTREHLLNIERASLLSLQRRGLVDAGTAQALSDAVNERLLALQSGVEPEIVRDKATPELEPAAVHTPKPS